MLQPSFSTMTSTGQLTIPKYLRDALGLQAGDQVRFDLDQANGRTVLAPVLHRPEELATFAVPGVRRMSFEDMEAAKRAGAQQ